MKRCAKCHFEKPISEFHKKGKGNHCYCKPCVSQYRKIGRKNGVLDTPIQKRNNNLFSRYRIREVDFQRMVSAQGGLCAICYNKLKKGCVDHDHASGNVRGILCRRCNTGLHLFDNQALLRGAIKYVSNAIYIPV